MKEEGEVVVGFGKPQEVTEEKEKEEGRECRGACIASWDEHLVLFAVLIHVYYRSKRSGNGGRRGAKERNLFDSTFKYNFLTGNNGFSRNVELDRCLDPVFPSYREKKKKRGE